MIFSQNNRKLGLVPSFSISTMPCRNIPQCRNCYNKYCYARKIERLYKPFRMRSIRNYKLTLKESFVDIAIKELRFLGDFCRIHVGGEFYSQEYINKWFKIASAYPKKIFYCYTKRYDLDFSGRPKNMVVYLSDDKLKLQKHYEKFDGVAYIRFDMKKPVKEEFRLCQNQIDKNVQCSDCLRCTKKNQKVCFNKH